MLTTGAAGPIGVDAKIFVVYFHLNVRVHFGKNGDRSKGSVSSSGCIEGRDPDHPMDTMFGFQVPVCVRSSYMECNVFDAGFIPRKILDDPDLHALVLAPAAEHPEKHFHPVLGLSSTGPGIDCNNCVSFIVRASK